MADPTVPVIGSFRKRFLQESDADYQAFLERLHEVGRKLDMSDAHVAAVVRLELGKDIGDNFDAWLEEQQPEGRAVGV